MRPVHTCLFCYMATVLLTSSPLFLQATPTKADPSDVASTRSDIDEEPDGLTNQEEAEADTYPHNAYSDADDKMDGQDGWPLDSGVTFPRIRETSYAVIDLNDQGAQWVQRITDSGLVWGRFDPYECKIWQGGELTALPNSHDDFEIYWTDMNQDGTVVGYGMNRDDVADKLFTFSGGELTELPRYPSEESQMYIQEIEDGIFITDNNDIYGNVYVVEDSDGQASSTHRVTTGVVKWTDNSPVLLAPGNIVRTTEMFLSSPTIVSVTPDPAYLLIAESVSNSGVLIGETNRLYFDSNDHLLHGEVIGTGLFHQGSFTLASEFGTQSRFAAASDADFSTVVGERSCGVALWQMNPMLSIIYDSGNSVTKIKGFPCDINDSGEIVGSGFTSPLQKGVDGQLIENGRVVDLSTRCHGFTISYARQITNTGLILAAGFNYAKQENSENLMLVPIEIDSVRATINPKFRGSPSKPYLCNNIDHITAGEKIEGALAIYHKAVRNEDGETEDFDVTLKVAPVGGNVTWTKSSGPDSGTIVDPNSATAIFRNPKKGGLYEFELSVGSQSAAGKLQLWLPVAGPDISSYWEGEISYFKNTWGPAYRSKLNDRTVLLALNPPARWMAKRDLAALDMLMMGSLLDWNGEILGDETPCGGPISTPGNRLTLHKFVISWSKRNNMMYALIGREMGLPERMLINAGHMINLITTTPSGTPSLDSPETVESYRAGFDLFNGVNLENVMKARGLKMHQPDGWDQWEWPSHETSEEHLQRMADQKLQDLIQ